MYVSERKSDGWKVAIKALNTDVSGNIDCPEMTLLKSCTSEFIVRYFDAFKKDGSYWVFNFSVVYA